MGRHKEVDIVSWVESHSIPKALGWLPCWLPVRPWTGNFSLREGSMLDRRAGELHLHFLKSNPPFSSRALSC